MRWMYLILLGLSVTLSLGACDSDGDSSGDPTDTGQDSERDVSHDTAVDTIADPTQDPVVDPAVEPVDDDTGTEDTTQDSEPEDVGTDVPCTLCGSECGDNERCIPAGQNEALVCRPVGPVPVGLPCGDAGGDDCVAGAVCVPYDVGVSFCRSLCSLTDTACTCAADEQLCVPWFGADSMTAGICLGSDCSPPDTDCPAQQRCTVLLDQVLECVPEGTVPPGGDCSVDDCQAGSICRGIDGQLLCRPFCQNASDCTEADTHCAWMWPDLTDWGYCRPGCDPILGTGCLETEGCYFMDPEVGETECWTAGSMTEGTDCSSFADFCEPGLDCVLEPDTADPFEYYCRAYCDDEHPCESPQECVQTEALGALKVCL